MFTLLTHRLCSLAYGEAGAQLPQSSCCEQSVLIAPRVNEFSVHICDHCYNPLLFGQTGYCETLDSHFVSAKWIDSNNFTYIGKVVAGQQLMLKVFLIIIMRLINNSNNSINLGFQQHVCLFIFVQVSLAQFPEMYKPGTHHKITIYCTYYCYIFDIFPGRQSYFYYPIIQIDLYVYGENIITPLDELLVYCHSS